MAAVAWPLRDGGEAIPATSDAVAPSSTMGKDHGAQGADVAAAVGAACAMMIKLSDDELSAVTTAAKPLPPEDRSRFLEALASLPRRRDRPRQRGALVSAIAGRALDRAGLSRGAGSSRSRAY